MIECLRGCDTRTCKGEYVPREFRDCSEVLLYKKELLLPAGFPIMNPALIIKHTQIER